MQKLRSDRVIGVLLFDSAGDRIVGDPGMPGTFPFPVCYGVVPGSYRDLIQGSRGACDRLCAAARELEARGVSAIAGDCGLMALYQKQLAKSVRVPVIASSLVLLPLAERLVGEHRKIGVLTGHSALLNERHLAGAGVDISRLVIQGMEDEPHFSQVVIEGKARQSYLLMRRDVLRAADKLLSREENIGAILLECSNLAAYGAELTRTLGIPVLDCGLAVRLLFRMVNPACYCPEGTPGRAYESENL